MIRATRVGLGSQEEPASFPARPPAQHQGLGDAPDSNCAVRSRRLAQCHAPHSAQAPGPSVCEGPGGHLGPGRDPPARAKGAVFSFPSFSCTAPPNRTSAQRPVWHPELPRCQPGPARPLPAPYRPHPVPSPWLRVPPGETRQPAPACWVPASRSPALGASGPACRPHTHLLSLYSSVSSRGDLEAGVTPLHDSPTTRPATSGRMGCLQTSTHPAAAPLPLCASVGLRMPPEVLMALPSPGTAQESSSAPKGPCRSSRRAHSRLWNEDARGGVAYRQRAFLSPDFGG